MPIVDILLIVIFAGVVWCVASCGATEAVMTFFTVLLAGIIAMNYYEPFAMFLESISSSLRDRSDMIAMLGLFAGLILGGRFLNEAMSPTFIHVQGQAHEAIRWICAIGTGYVTMAFLLTSLHTAPLPETFLGFKPDRKNLFDMVAPDRHWLGFTQYVTEKPFNRTVLYSNGTTATYMFDGRTSGDWGLPETQAPTVMPSFIIRYADRRAMLAGTIDQQGPTVKEAPRRSGPGF